LRAESILPESDGTAPRLTTSAVGPILKPVRTSIRDRKGLEMHTYVLYVILGFVVGVFGGVVGLGGGIVMIPALVVLFGFSQHEAQGTTLAMMVPPIGIAAAWVYYKQGQVDLKVAALCALGFVLGGFFGAKLATALPNAALRKVFGVALLAISLRMVLTK